MAHKTIAISVLGDDYSPPKAHAQLAKQINRRLEEFPGAHVLTTNYDISQRPISQASNSEILYTAMALLIIEVPENDDEPQIIGAV